MPTTLRSAKESVPAPLADARAGKHLTFQRDGEECGIRVLKVRKFMGWRK